MSIRFMAFVLVCIVQAVVFNSVTDEDLSFWVGGLMGGLTGLAYAIGNLKIND